MKVGAENRTKTILAVVMLALGVFLAVRGFGSFFSPPPQAQAAATPQPAATQARRTRSQPGRRPATPVLSPTLDPRLRLDLLNAAEHTTYEGNGRNIFRAESEPAPIPGPVKNPDLTKNQTPQPPPGPPPPPPIPLRFFGFANKPGEPKRVFLADGSDVFVAAEGQIVDRRYKVLHIGVNSVDVQDVLNNNVQTLPLLQG